MLSLLVTSLLVGACQRGEDTGESDGISPQVRPVRDLLTAVKSGDEDQFSAVFSEWMQAQLQVTGWDEVLKTYGNAFSNEFGEYNIEDFTFEFTGRETQGQISASHNGKSLPGLNVIKEKRGWKVGKQ